MYHILVILALIPLALIGLMMLVQLAPFVFLAAGGLIYVVACAVSVIAVLALGGYFAHGIATELVPPLLEQPTLQHFVCFALAVTIFPLFVYMIARGVIEMFKPLLPEDVYRRIDETTDPDHLKAIIARALRFKRA